MNKSDYMKLSKEKLAELLAERDKSPIFYYQPAIGGKYNPPCYAPDGICVNPQHDCINCPKLNNSGGYATITGTLNVEL